MKRFNRYKGIGFVGWRDTLRQERISKDRLAEYLTDQLGRI